MTRVLAWVTPAGWEACVDAAAALAGAEVTLLYVADTGPGPAERLSRSGPAERVVTELAAGFDLPVLSRTNLRPGPHSLGHAARFVVDHAPCALLLVWPGTPGPRRV